MKILILATDAYGGYGGIAQYNRDFIAALSSNTDVERTEVLVRAGSAPFGDIPSKTVQFPPRQSKVAYALVAIYRAIRMRPDVIVSGHLYCGPLAAALAKLIGARLISQLHGTEVWSQLSCKHLVPLEQSDVVLCVSRDTRQRLINQTLNLYDRAIVVSNTFGDHFAEGDRFLARQRFGLTKERAIVTVARLDGRDGYKGHDRIINLLPALSRATSDPVVYLIAGVGEDRERLERLAHSLNVGNLVRFLGKVSDVDMPDLYRASDLFALPSTGEGFGIAFIEAMACGTPAIGLAVGGAPDALGDGELGHCVRPADFNLAFFNAIELSRERDPTLSRRVNERFGRVVFNARLRDILSGFICKVEVRSNQRNIGSVKP
jgi:phosphatidylinositol alpha-1,6-mannosyltransferase